MTTTSENDFDSAKAVAEQLTGMDKERQQRILRWVAESLGLDFGKGESTLRRTSDTGTGSEEAGTAHNALQRHHRERDRLISRVSLIQRNRKVTFNLQRW